MSLVSPASPASLDEQLSRGFVLLSRLLDPAETVAPGEAAESVLARVTEKARDGEADVTVPAGRPELAGLPYRAERLADLP